MFGSRTTVKKVRNSLTWFSHSCKLLVLLWAKTSKISLAMMISLGRNTASSRNWRDGSRRWPLAVMLLTANMWITLTGFCWMLLGTGHTYSQTHLLPFTKCLTMKLAVYLAKEIAAILRAVLIQRARNCTITVWCTCFAPITGYNNATREGERKRPGPRGVTPAATTEGEKLSCRQLILDGPESGSCGHSQAIAGGTGKPMCADYRDGFWESRC